MNDDNDQQRASSETPSPLHGDTRAERLVDAVGDRSNPPTEPIDMGSLFRALAATARPNTTTHKPAAP